MVKLWGRELSKAELHAYVGDMEQVAGIRRQRNVEGPEYGMLSVLLRTGGGLNLTVLPDRGMDIAAAEYAGQPLAWRSPTGDVAAPYYEPEGLGWLRSFGGGLVTTCGLLNVGTPNTDNGEALGLHGRISNTPARDVCTEATWMSEEQARLLWHGFATDMQPEGETYVMWTSGKLREARVFGENLRIHRRILARLGERRFFLHDTIENAGWERAPLMLLYHCNLGWPLLDDTAEMITPTSEVQPYDIEAQAGIETYNRFQPPTPGFHERVFLHTLRANADGWVTTALLNRTLGLGLQIRYRLDELPYFTEWQMTGQGHYVVGFEPGTCNVLGRNREREAGRLQHIDPHQRREFHLEFGVLVGDELDKVAQP